MDKARMAFASSAVVVVIGWPQVVTGALSSKRSDFSNPEILAMAASIYNRNLH
jgi:hypothetical protein